MPLKIADLNWMHVADHLTRDDRAVAPLGSVEQHAHLSLATDVLLAERVAVEAAEPLGAVVFPVVAYGMVPCPPAVPGGVRLGGRPLPPVAGRGPVTTPVAEGRRRRIDGL
jgi:creatinine amidohydrolase